MDYFPHTCNHGQTMFIIEQRYGNDGYAFWFKLLETLGSSDGHYIDLGNVTAWEFLQAKTRLDEGFCAQILDLLARLNAIDRELWEHARVVWCQKFVDGVMQAYTFRKSETPTRPSFYIQKPADGGVSQPENPQTKLKETKDNKDMCVSPETHALDSANTEDEKTTDKPAKPKRQPYPPEFEQFWSIYPRRKEKVKAGKAWAARLKAKEDDITPALLILAARNYAAECKAKGTEEQFIKLPATFLGPAKPYLDYLAAPKEDKPAADDTPMEEYLERLGVKDEGRYSPV